MIHKYDTPGLTPIEFLNEVRNDPTVPSSLRRKAGRCLRQATAPAPEPTAPAFLDKCYETFLNIAHLHHAKFGGKYKSADFYIDIMRVMNSYHRQFPDKLMQDVEFYCDLLHIQRCWEQSVKTGKIVNPDLEATEPEGHA